MTINRFHSLTTENEAGKGWPHRGQRKESLSPLLFLKIALVDTPWILSGLKSVLLPKNQTSVYL